MKRTIFTLTLLVSLAVAGFTQITDPFFEKVTYVGAFGKTDWTQGWANWTPQTTNYPAATVTVGDGSTVTSASSTNQITTNTRWSSSASPVVGNASFTNPNLSDPFFEQVNYVGAFGTYDWTAGWANWDPQNAVYPATNVTVAAGHITTNTTWDNAHTYLLNGWVYVDAGVTLTIQPGTVIRGDKTNKGTLIMERGSKLNAIGTAAQPIIFTSNQSVGARDRGDWGGIILCGYATINQPGGTAVIEGGVGAIYGGGSTPNNADNSGTLKYVRCEYAGYPFAPDNEINGITFGGVGNGTTIDYVQVSYSNDDSYEWFGGTVNCKHLIAFRGLDDEFDTDNGFSGKLQFLVALRDPAIADISGSNGFESDNDASGSTNLPLTHPIFSNVSIFGPLVTLATGYNSNFKRAMHIRRNSTLCVYNSVFAGWPVGLLIDGNNTWTNASSNVLQIENCIMSGMTANFAATGTTFTATDVQNWYLTPSRHNSVLTNNTELGLVDPFNLAGPNFTPARTIYHLNGWLYVRSGATLTIDPGTIIRGDKTNKSALIIERGGKLIANGTVTEPIIFTSNEAAGARARGDWGGVILCGYATVNLPGGTGTIEGGVGSTFGGGASPNDADNSGSLKYVRIEFPGYAFAPNNEINGLTHGGIGSGTVEDYIQVSYSADDSYEWFGGTINGKHLIAFRGQDDEFDTDNGFAGKYQFCVGLRENFGDVSGSNGFESDNDAAGDGATPITQGTFSNFTIVGPMVTLATSVSGDFKRAMHLRRNTQLKVHNCLFMGWPTGLMIDGDNTQANATASLLQVENTFMSGMTNNFGVPSSPPSLWSVSDEQTWYMTPTRHNNTFVNNTDIQLVDPFNLSGPNFLPAATSPVWGASTWSRTISGAVRYDNTALTPMNGTTVYLKTQAGAVVETVTANVSGNYSVFAIDGVYVLDASSSKTWGGLSLIGDVIKLRQKLANLVTFTALQNKTSDVNQTNSVNIFDVTVMRQKLANMPNIQWNIPNFVFETPTITLSGSNVTQDIKSLAGGDCDKSYIPPTN